MRNGAAGTTDWQLPLETISGLVYECAELVNLLMGHSMVGYSAFGCYVSGRGVLACGVWDER